MPEAVDLGGDIPVWIVSRSWQGNTAERDSRRAWEHANVVGSGYSVWRMASPASPPHTHWIVVALGERRANLEKAERRIKKVPNSRHWRMPKDQVLAHARRRLDQARENMRATGSVGGNTVNEGMRSRMDRAGRMHPEGD